MKKLSPDDLPTYIGKEVAVTVVDKTHAESSGLLGHYEAKTFKATLLGYDDETRLLKIKIGSGNPFEVNPERVEAIE